MRFSSNRIGSGLTNGSGTRSSGRLNASEIFRRAVRRRGPLLVTLLALTLLIAALAIGRIVHNSIRQMTRESLRSILTANVAALEIWLAERKKDASRHVSDPLVRSAANDLIAKSTAEPAWTAKDAMSLESFERLERNIQSDGYLGWALVSANRLVVASTREALVGKQLPIPADTLSRLNARESTVCRPFRCPVAIEPSGSLSMPEAPLMAAMGPIHRGEQMSGSLMLLLDPLEKFSKILSVARTGVSSETYALDRHGVLLSQSRFEPQLRDAGLLDPDPLVASPLNVSVRDPGVNLVQGEIASLDRPLQPLTFMADQATRGATGENVSGYNDYRGVPVVGVWTWLPEFQMGVTTEMDVVEAYKPTHLLWQSFLGLILLLGFVAIGLLGLAPALRRFSRRSPSTIQPGRRLGRYQQGELLGRGGMGAVYRGTHELLRRDVAIKVLEKCDASEQSISRFQREVQMTAQLRHPNTIDLYDYGHCEDGTFFYVMEYVDGITLQDLIEDYGAQPPERVIHLLLQICGSLAEAHHLGLIHRDIKPANVLLTAQAGIFDMVKVLDFGLVKEVGSMSSDMTLTQMDGITGTPMYMSPEAVRDAATADTRSDLYSVGAVGYTLLTGEPLFEGNASVDICLKQLNDEPQRPSQRLGQPLPEDLQNVLMSCLRKDPDQRPLSIDDLAAALRQCEHAGLWETSDALHWWEVVFDDRAATPAGPSSRTHVALTSEGDSGTTAH